MKYEIKRIGRTVELDDELVKEYIKYSPLRDSSFTIVLRCTYGEKLSKVYPSDTDLSLICNECLLNELKAINMLPKALEYIEKHYEEWTNGTMQSINIGDL